MIDVTNFAMKLDPVLFARAAKFDPDPWQIELLRSQHRRICVLCGRQCGKSETIAVKVLHRAIFYPKSTIIMCGRAGRQANEGFKRVRDRLRELDQPFEEIEEGFPDIPGLEEDKKTSLLLSNRSRVIAIPNNPAGVRSFSAVNLVVADEAAFIQDDLFSAIVPMLATVSGQLCMLSSAWAKQGIFYLAATSTGDDWHRIKIRSDECPRITKEDLAGYRSLLGDFRYRCEFLCEWVESGASLFSSSDIDRSLTDDSEEVADIWGDALLDQPKPEPVPESVRNILPGVPVGYEDELEDDRWS